MKEFRDGSTKSLPCVPGSLCSFSGIPVIPRGVSKADPVLATLTPTFLHLHHPSSTSLQEESTRNLQSLSKTWELQIFPLNNDNNPLVPASGTAQELQGFFPTLFPFNFGIEPNEASPKENQPQKYCWRFKPQDQHIQRVGNGHFQGYWDSLQGFGNVAG